MTENNNTFQKDPQAILPYSVDWGKNWLGSDTIAASSWAVTGLVQVGSSFTDDVATVVISGGVVGQTYALVNSITTALGYKDERTVFLVINDK